MEKASFLSRQQIEENKQLGEIKSKVQTHDSDLEFFKLTLLSLQLNHKNFRLVKTIDANSLYHLAKDQNLQFTKYYEFLKEEVDKHYLIKYKNAEPERFLGKEKELKEYNGAKIYVDINDVS